MRIVVLDYAASSGGALSILKDFYSFLEKSNDENEWYFLLSGEYLTGTDRIHICVEPKGKWLKRLWFDLWRGREYINSLKPDIIVSLQNTLPIGVKGRKYLYIHQPIPFQKKKKFSFLKKDERVYAFYQYVIGLMIKRSARKADKIFVQTNWLKAALHETCGKDKEILVCQPTVSKQEFEKGEFSPYYFVYPAAPIIYKNHEVILKACEILHNNDIDGFTVEFTCDGTDKNGIHYIGNISRSQVFQKYTQGTLIFPSYIESYGYPLKEAQMQNTIILSADCEYAHEVLAGYRNAYFFPFLNAQKLAELMLDVIEGRIVPAEDTAAQKEGAAAGWEVLLKCVKSENER
jgi:glycosyltransferase involved in cell wall biosynthesis